MIPPSHLSRIRTVYRATPRERYNRLLSWLIGCPFKACQIFAGLQPINALVNIHRPWPEYLRLWGYAYVILVLPLGRSLSKQTMALPHLRVKLSWLKSQRWPAIEVTRFTREDILQGGKQWI